MKKKVFYSACLYPTGTLIAGSEYDVIDETDERITVINENGNKVSLSRYRFGEIFMKEVKEASKVTTGVSKVKCLDSEKFRWLTKGKEYTIEKETDKFFTVKNDYGVTARYSKKYFDVLNPKSEEKEQDPKVDLAICKYPVATELSFKRSYPFTTTKPGHIVVKNDKGLDAEYLVSRFTIKKAKA